jgi:hypothetical protein
MAASYSLRSPPLNFTLLVVNRPLVTQAAPHSWHRYIEDLSVAHEDIDVDSVKVFIQEIIDEGRHNIASQFGVTSTIIRKINTSLLLGQVLFNGNLHCELVLASLSKHPPSKAVAIGEASDIIPVSFDVMLPTFVFLTTILGIGYVHNFRIKVMLSRLLGVLKVNARQR